MPRHNETVPSVEGEGNLHEATQQEVSPRMTRELPGVNPSDGVVGRDEVLRVAFDDALINAEKDLERDIVVDADTF